MNVQYVMTRKTTAWILSERAPKGQLNAATAQLEAIRTSLKVNPDWDNKVAQWMQDRSQQRIRESWAMTNATLQHGADQHNALMANAQAYNTQTRAEYERHNNQFRAGQDAKTRHSADEVDYLLDQQYYVNPANGQKSTISTTYTNNWQNGTGQQVLSNIQGYDPNANLPGNWTQLQPINH